MYELIGAFLGGLSGFFGLFLYAQYYAAHASDPTAAGGIWILTFITVPAGVVIGTMIGFIVRLVIKRAKR